MNLISKSIRTVDVQSDDRLIERMQNSRFGWVEIRDLIIARYRQRNLRMRVLVTFNQTVKTKKFSDEVNAAIKAIDAEVAALGAIEAALNAEQSPDNVVCLDDARSKQDKAA
jgi:hypothetical protein